MTDSKRELNTPQPESELNEHPAVWDLVIEDIARGEAFAEAEYGTRLQPHNARDALVDAYEEALDLCLYLRQMIYERDAQ